MSFTSRSRPPTKPFHPFAAPATLSPPKEKFKIKQERKKKRKEGKISLWKLQCDIGSQAVNPFIHSSFHAGVHHKESLVWFQALSLCYTKDTEPSLNLFLDTSLLPCVMEIMQPWTTEPCSLHPNTYWLDQHLTTVLCLGSCGVGQSARLEMYF